MKLALKPENLAQLVFFIRGEKVMLDADLAALYGVRPKALNQAVKRNNARFPADFCFQLTAKEWADLKSRISGTTAQAADNEAPAQFHAASRSNLPPIRLHRARCGDALQRSAKQACRRGQCRN